jgi:hypothetical protein
MATSILRVDPDRDLDRSRRADHWYADAATKLIPALIPARPAAFLKVLLDGLQQAAEFKARDAANSEYDASPWWRPAVEEHEQNFDFDFPSRLVGHTRQAFEVAIEKSYLSLSEALAELDLRQRLIFKRLRMHLINRFGDRDPFLARRTIMDREMLDKSGFKHEYAMLCRDRFTLLLPEERTEWLSWIDRGPDLTEFAERYEERFEEKPSEPQSNEYVRDWKLKRLHWVRDHLNGETAQFYESLLAELGEPELADMSIKMGRLQSGSRSPLSFEDLADKDFADVVELVCSWRPPERRSAFGPSFDGLAEIFRAYLLKSPARFVPRATLMIGRPPLFVATYLSAICRAFEVGNSFDLGPLCDLCSWVLRQSLSNQAGRATSESMSFDRWDFASDCISSVVKEACSANCALEFRERFWHLLGPLTDSSGQSCFVDSKNPDIRLKDYTSDSMSSPAGRAMHAVFAYARWVALSMAKDGDRKEGLDSGFKYLPEVRALLEAKLRDGGKGGFSLRATYGCHWSLIRWIDANWLAANAAKICDLAAFESSPGTAYGWAAWNSFLSENDASIEDYQLLRDQFHYALRQAAVVQPKERNDFHRPFDRFAEHLVVLYGRGELSLSDDDGILQKLFTVAAPAIRTHAIQFIGESLWRNNIRGIPDDFRHRYAALWDWYWDTIGEMDTRTNGANCTFAYWIASRAFGDSWALERLEQFLRVAINPEPWEDMIAALQGVSHLDILRSVRIVDTLLISNREPWRMFTAAMAIKAILRAGIAAGNDAREIAGRTIDRLGRLGFLEFGELMRESTGSNGAEEKR